MRTDELGRSLLRLALRIAPPARRDTVRAMWSEFEHCEQDPLGWALGGLGAALFWRIAADWLYAVSLITMPVIMPMLGFMLFQLLFGDRNLPLELWETSQFIFLTATMFLTAVAMGLYRPSNAIFTALVCVIVSFAVFGWSSDWFAYVALWVLGTASGSRLPWRLSV